MPQDIPQRSVTDIVKSIAELDDILEDEAYLKKSESVKDEEAKEVVQAIESTDRAIPEHLEDALFFLYLNGLPFDEIVKKYEKSETPFTKKQLYRFSHKNKWAQRKDEILRETKTDFTDMIRFSQSKRMTAISMAVQAVSDLIVNDVQDLRKDPRGFWKEVQDMQRPRPFWLARNVDELMGLFKLQKSLEEGLVGSNDDGGIADADRAVLLKALADAANSQVEILKGDPSIIEGEITKEDVGSK